MSGGDNHTVSQSKDVIKRILQILSLHQMGLIEDDYPLRFLGFKLQIERISASADHLYL